MIAKAHATQNEMKRKMNNYVVCGFEMRRGNLKAFLSHKKHIKIVGNDLKSIQFLLCWKGLNRP